MLNKYFSYRTLRYIHLRILEQVQDERAADTQGERMRLKSYMNSNVFFLPLILSALRSFMRSRVYRRMEYAVEINRLIAMEMEDSIG